MLECYLSNRKVSGSILESTGSHASFPGQTLERKIRCLTDGVCTHYVKKIVQNDTLFYQTDSHC